MQLKKFTIILLGLLVFTSCGEEFLELEPKGTETEANFYQTQEQIYQGLISVYDVLSWGGTRGWTMTLGLLNAASDDCFAGGSDRSDQPAWVAWDEFILNPELGPQEGLWDKYYTGIARANLILEKIPLTEGLDQSFLDRVTAECRFLTAHFYFDLVRTFGNVILTTERISPSQILDQVQVSQDVIFDQIESDLMAAYNEPNIPDVVPASELGRVGKGPIAAMLGKTILYSNNEARFGEAAAYFEEVINSSNYALESDFANIFSYDNEWGTESVWEVQHSEKSRGGWDRFGNGTEGNYTTQFIGMRDYVGPTSSQYMGENFATGWSFNPVSTDLVDFMKNDPRYIHTIIDGNMLKNLGATYTVGYQNTDYFVRKYAGIEEFKAPDGEPALNWANNEKLIRLADVLLMAAECHVRGDLDEAKARGYINRVRSRVGLQPISNAGESLLNSIYRERRMELATEGHRFFDLVRTGKAAEVLEGFVSGTHEHLPIPQREIDLTAGALIQNPGY